MTSDKGGEKPPITYVSIADGQELAMAIIKHPEKGGRVLYRRREESVEGFKFRVESTSDRVNG